MSQHFQVIIDREAGKITEMLKAGAPTGYKVINTFQDFYRLVDNCGFEIELIHASQILDLMDSIKQHGKMSDYHEAAALGVLVSHLVYTDGQDATILNRLIIDSVAVSLRNIEAKEQYPVAGGRFLFEFFAMHASVLSDEAFKTLFDNSVPLTRYAGSETSQNNLLFGCTNSYFQQECPANCALSHLVAYHTDMFEEEINWWDDYGWGGKCAGRLRELQNQIARIDGLGIRLNMHHADAIFITGLSVRLLSIREKGVMPEYAEGIEETVTTLLRMTTPDRPQALASNLFRFHGRPYTNSTKEKATWLNRRFCEEYHQDLLDNLGDLDAAIESPSIRQAFEAFSWGVLINAAQAQHNLKKDSAFDNASFLEGMTQYCNTPFEQKNPLAGLKKIERLAVLESIKDMQIKRLLLKQYKSDKGHVLTHDLGM